MLCWTVFSRWFATSYTATTVPIVGAQFIAPCTRLKGAINCPPTRACLVALVAFSAICSSLVAFAALLEAQSGLLTIKYRDPNDRAQLEFVFKAWRGAVRDLEQIGLKPQATTLNAFSSATEFARMTGEPWFISASTRGTVIRTQRLGALQKRGILEFTIRHEAFHTVQPATLPRWLAEGLARHFSREDARDPRGPTGLETVSDAALETILLGRGDQSKLNIAYYEATQRAAKLVRKKGWKVALQTR
jgi:hypothetical protein